MFQGHAPARSPEDDQGAGVRPAAQPQQQAQAQPARVKRKPPAWSTDQTLNLIIAVGILWGCVKLWYLDATFTLIFFESVGWIEANWDEGGLDIWSVGMITWSYLFPAMISVVQWALFPWEIAPDDPRNPSVWTSRIKLRDRLGPREWLFWIWAGTSFFNVGTTFRGLAIYVRGEQPTSAMNVLPLWDVITLPTAGFLFFVICLAVSLLFSQGPESFGKRAWALATEQFKPVR